MKVLESLAPCSSHVPAWMAGYPTQPAHRIRCARRSEWLDDRDASQFSKPVRTPLNGD